MLRPAAFLPLLALLLAAGLAPGLAATAGAQTFGVDGQTFAARMRRAGYPVACTRAARGRDAECRLGGIRFALEGDRVAGVIAAEWPWAERHRMATFARAFVAAVGGSAEDQAATARLEAGDTVRGRPVTVHGWSASLRGVRCCAIASVSDPDYPRLEIFPREPDEEAPAPDAVRDEVLRLRAGRETCGLDLDEARLAGFLAELGLPPEPDPDRVAAERGRLAGAGGAPGARARLCGDLAAKFGESGTLLQGVAAAAPPPEPQEPRPRGPEAQGTESVGEGTREAGRP